MSFIFKFKKGKKYESRKYKKNKSIREDEDEIRNLERQLQEIDRQISIMESNLRFLENEKMQIENDCVSTNSKLLSVSATDSLQYGRELKSLGALMGHKNRQINKKKWTNQR
ncbi:hypothetical protein [Spiroplasma ixodetis]|uniref:hypothetical protein n=1 Tax=Spiroplasma ixodetis TaxID=2141 RepID=UPI002577B556|nr:hypothetical protein [Spiroplasma ixodetis]WJG71159.1 hypothetical protein SIXOD_v1c25100 [Spiroplasma ixodetis Y32]